WSFRLGLLKEISHPGRPYPHEHFYKLRSADGEEWSAGFARDGLSQQGFARSRRTDKQDAFGNPSAHTGKLLRRPEEFNDLPQFLLRFIDPCHIGKSNGYIFFHIDLGFRLADPHQAAFLSKTGKDPVPNSKEDNRRDDPRSDI